MAERRILATSFVVIVAGLAAMLDAAPPAASRPARMSASAPASQSRLLGGLLNEQEAIQRLRRRFRPLPVEVECLGDELYRTVGGEELRMDVYRPRGDDGVRPAVIYVHGGGWRGGDKRMNRDMFVDLVQRGYVVFSVNYRLAPEFIFPACAEDCCAALRFIRAHATKYGVDGKRVGLIGASAGGHLVALIGAAGNDDFRTRQNADQDQSVAAVVALYGVFDLRHLPKTMGMPLVNAFLGGPESSRPDAYRRASPQAFVEAAASRPAEVKKMPAFLLIHGDADQLINIRQAQNMNAALRKAGIESELITVHNGGHGLVTGNMEPTPEEFHRRMYEFLDGRLHPVRPDKRVAASRASGERS